MTWNICKHINITYLLIPLCKITDNLNNVRHEARRHFRNKKKEYLKPKIYKTNSKIKNIRDLDWSIKGFKKGYQSRINIVKDEKGNLVSDSHSILARCRNHFFHLFNIHGDKDTRQMEIHMAVTSA